MGSRMRHASWALGDFYLTRVDYANFLAALVVSAADNLEGILARGDDNALLRFALGAEYLKAGALDKAVQHLGVAVTIDPDYSAAWKLLGKAQAGAGLTAAASETYLKGIEVATRCGDRRSAKEMEVFLKRLEKSG